MFNTVVFINVNKQDKGGCALCYRHNRENSGLAPRHVICNL